MKYKASLTLLSACLALAGASLAKPGMSINKEITLAPGHKAAPYLITRASNGDYIVAGSTGGQDRRAWAVRVDSAGKKLWEYVDGGPAGWNDFDRPGHRLYGAVDLPNQETLLCGLKSTPTARTALLIRVRRDGSVIDERTLVPGRPGMVVEISCTGWGDSIAILGAVAGNPAGSGWLVKLDPRGEFIWERFDEFYGYGDALQAPAGNLILFGGRGETGSIVKINSDGLVLAHHPQPKGEVLFIHPSIPRSTVRLGVMLLDSLETDVVDFDESLRGPTRTKRLDNAGLKKCLELDDGTVVLFGSQFHHSMATPSIAILYPDGSSGAFPIVPAGNSGWINDAVPSGLHREFATVRQVEGVATLAWISIR